MVWFEGSGLRGCLVPGEGGGIWSWGGEFGQELSGSGGI